MRETRIAWTNSTFNPWRGCEKVSPACKNCYAEREAKRFPDMLGVFGPVGIGTRVVAADKRWAEVRKWNREDAGKTGLDRRRVFCASVADVFEDWTGDMIDHNGYHLGRLDDGQFVRTEHHRAAVHLKMDHVRARLFRLIEETPSLDWQLLTKRTGNIMRMVPDGWQRKFPPNVWIGATVENQNFADIRIPELLEVPASVRWLSMEPLLEAVTLGMTHSNGSKRNYLNGEFSSLQYVDGRTKPVRHVVDPNSPRIHWIVTGGESGDHAREFDITSARYLRDQCRYAGAAFFMKQTGGIYSLPLLDPDGTTGTTTVLLKRGDKGDDMSRWPDDLRIQEFPTAGKGVAA